LADTGEAALAMHLDRRALLKAALGTLAVPAWAACGRERDPWSREAYARPERSPVAVLRAESYDGPLADLVRRGLELFDLELGGRRVVLKPNFVEFDPDGAVNTHPALIAATIDAFRVLGAREVIVAEGPGHRRDTEHLVAASGLLDALRDTRTRYVNLNADHVRKVPTRSHYSSLGALYLPETVLGADLLVSMPKLKTHHWTGVTLSMKNLFGIMPGAIYGWPKNVLHFAGIPESILDINAALPVPRFNIVDGIIGMEGNGPIDGASRRSGLLVLGADPVAVDVTATRLMGLDPTGVGYLREAARFLGNSSPAAIEQRGEPLQPLAQPFAPSPGFEALAAARSIGG
jgi:uncharacterized protein (DUF362 family)